MTGPRNRGKTLVIRFLSTYCQYNKVLRKNLRNFLKLLSPITGHFHLFIYLFIRVK